MNYLTSLIKDCEKVIVSAKENTVYGLGKGFLIVLNNTMGLREDAVFIGGKWVDLVMKGMCTLKLNNRIINVDIDGFELCVPVLDTGDFDLELSYEGEGVLDGLVVNRFVSVVDEKGKIYLDGKNLYFVSDSGESMACCRGALGGYEGSGVLNSGGFKKIWSVVGSGLFDVNVKFLRNGGIEFSWIDGLGIVLGVDTQGKVEFVECVGVKYNSSEFYGFVQCASGIFDTKWECVLENDKIVGISDSGIMLQGKIGTVNGWIRMDGKLFTDIVKACDTVVLGMGELDGWCGKRIRVKAFSRR